jgi:hypothetical protein
MRQAVTQIMAVAERIRLAVMMLLVSLALVTAELVELVLAVVLSEFIIQLLLTVRAYPCRQLTHAVVTPIDAALLQAFGMQEVTETLTCQRNASLKQVAQLFA